MGKQYTFKTTKDTEWLEEHLDKLPSQDRSRVIRMALCVLFDNVRPAVAYTKMVTPLEQQEVTQITPVTPKVTQSFIDTKVDMVEPLFEAKEVDLDAKLNNLFD